MPRCIDFLDYVQIIMQRTVITKKLINFFIYFMNNTIIKYNKIKYILENQFLISVMVTTDFLISKIFFIVLLLIKDFFKLLFVGKTPKF